MVLTLSISENDYPLIFKLYKREQEKKVEEIFKTGYNIHFPNVKDHNMKTEYHMLLKGIEDVKQNIYNENQGSVMDNKMEELLLSIQKLTGISNNSSKKGEVGENMLEEIINQRYGDIIFESKAKTPHCGDAWLYLPNDRIIMLESKNYSYRINKDEVEKMEFDMKTNHIRFGIFVSWNSVVQSRKDIDLHTFNHNNETYMIVIISNLADDIIKLDLSFQILRKLMENFYDMKNFPWIIKDIKQNLKDFDEIIQKNYKLRDEFQIMSNSVKNCIDCFYYSLRDYQYELSKSAKEIINKIESTMNNSIENQIDYSIEEVDFLSEFKENQKVFPVISCLFDTFKKLDISFEKENESTIVLSKLDEQIGFIKVQKKKLLLNLIKYNIVFELDSGNYSESLHLIPDICKNI